VGSLAAAAPPAEHGVRLSELNYHLPPELIAQRPAEPRDAARLLVCRRPPQGGPATIEDRHFNELPALLCAGDLLVRNNTRVLPARTFFRRPSGGRLEVLFLHARDGSGRTVSPSRHEVWEVLVRGRPRTGETLTVDGAGEWSIEVVEELGDGRWLVSSHHAEPVAQLLGRFGAAPLPPYIRDRLDDPERYQTVFARVPGSAAAPTAGLHFTRRLDGALAATGIEILELTLHVGLGTFKPLAAEQLEQNELHAESYELPAQSWARVQQAKQQGRRIVAVGTTMVRLLEHLANGAPAADGMLRGCTRLFITPGYQFRMVDAVITNFHLPRTSLLALVMAFCGVQQTLDLYAHAIAERYRFYSFGDAMLAL
jgi:S-adenosylmethionine:tRNA ribosyltransferase-isomerase